MRNLIMNLIFVALAITGCKPAVQIDVHDDFESDTLSKIWTGDKLLPGALNFQSECVRSGKMAAKISVHKGDQIEEEKGTVLERGELKESKKLFTPENISYSYSFSFFLPPDFPQVPTRLVIAQWKQDCKSGNCDPDNPVIAVRYKSGQFFVTLQTSPEQIILYNQSESILNQWIDFKINIRFSRNGDGVIKAWLNDKQIIDYKGVTAYSQKYGYPMPGIFYFKTGIYRDTMADPMTIYIDNYRKQYIPKL
jgi:hypothetical protein